MVIIFRTYLHAYIFFNASLKTNHSIHFLPAAEIYTRVCVVTTIGQSTTMTISVMIILVVPIDTATVET